jgi:energy-coupling factor transporter ATP-binding protein EcfA2
MAKTKEERVEFRESTKRIIAQRAGAKCSYPSCNKTLVGPGKMSNQVINVGECAHIFSAVENGPRGDGGLSEEELRSPENGIYLCREHHNIIDSKSTSNMYTSDLLSQIKYRHELSISAEIGEYLYPLNWIKSICINESPICNNSIKINFGKVTHIYGNNGTGKSALVEFLSSCFKQNIHERWNESTIKVKMEISMDNSIARNFDSIIENGLITYKLNDEIVPFVPYDIQIIMPISPLSPNEFLDDIDKIATTLGFTEEQVYRILTTTGVKHGLFAKSIRVVEEEKFNNEEFEDEETNDVNQSSQKLRRLKIVIKGKEEHEWYYGQLSGTEKTSVLLDLLISFATELCKYRSILLILDWEQILSFGEGTIRPYLEYLMSTEAHFQTIYVTLSPSKNSAWLGWTLAELKESQNSGGSTKNIEVDQIHKF